jgi:NAD(P)-dependent dehydrogenase (short-subunit alcohol dehydrogenase family)
VSFVLSELSRRVAVVTGGGGGIGAALCRGMADRGMRVVVADIDEAAATEVARGLPDATACGVDVADASAVARLADLAFDTFGSVDLLCNNAGVFQGGLAWERSTADWNWTLGVNLYGIIHAIDAFVPRMLAQGTDGHIVNTASVAAFVSTPLSAPYVVSKAAALSLSECLAHDLASVQSRIGVSVLVPSAIDTDIAGTARVRPTGFGADTTDDGASTVEFLRAMTAAGLDPAAVVAPVLEAVRTGTFLIPTKPSYAAQLQTRFDGLVARQLPDVPVVD